MARSASYVMTVQVVLLIARNTLREAFRQQLVVILISLALLLLGGGRLVGAFNLGASELKFVSDYGFGVIAFFGSILAVVGTSQVFFSEIEQRTIFVVLSKPISRTAYLIGKIVGVLGLITLFWVIMLGTLMAVLWMMALSLPEGYSWRPIEPAPMFAIAYAQLLKFVVLSALVTLIASFATTQLFTSIAGFALGLICHLQTFVQHAVEHTTTGWTLRTAKAFAILVPDFQAFDLHAPFVEMEGVHWTQLGRLTAFTVLYVTAITSLAAWAFRRREL